MNKIAAPEQFNAEGEQGDWSYGTRVEAPLAPEGEHEARGPEIAPHHDAPPQQEKREAPPAQEEQPKDAPPPPAPKLLFLIVGLVLLALLAWGIYLHWQRSSSAAATSSAMQTMVPEVRVAEAKADDKPISLTLPAQTEAFSTATIYPRATGYISVRKVDIGSRVKKGDLLAHIAAPDLDQQLQQAIAQLGQVEAAEGEAQAQVTQAKANLDLAKVTLARTSQLTEQGYATLQTRDNQTATQQSQQAALDTANAAVKVADANTKAQQATVDRLKALTAFEDVIAPFDGVITMRNVDKGDLVNADSATAVAMFAIAEDDIIRVTVQVPQNAAIGVRDGLDAKIEIPQMPGDQFTGKVSRTSVALISTARTLDTEVDIANPEGRLRPGLYAYVTIAVPREHPGVVIPAEALIFDARGLQVALLEGDKVRLRPIKIYRDFGTTVELSDGLKGGERIILSPPAVLKDGMTVKPQPEDKDGQGQGQGGTPQDDAKRGTDQKRSG